MNPMISLYKVMHMLCFIFALLVVLLDQFFKEWVLQTIPVSGSMELIPGVIGLTHVENTGAAFSILSDQQWLLIAIAIVVVGLLIAVLLRYNEGFWGTISLAAILGGAVGNLIDRIIRDGKVIDMFRLEFMDFAIFNIADIFITLGGITFLVYFIITAIRPKKSVSSLAASAPAEYVAPERPSIEEEIGLYDFQYGEEPPVRDAPIYEAIADTLPQAIAEIEAAHNAPSEPEPEPLIPDEPPEYEPERDSSDADIGTATLEALEDLEKELLGGGDLDDYDVDKMLQEYGFEDDADKM